MVLKDNQGEIISVITDKYYSAEDTGVPKGISLLSLSDILNVKLAEAVFGASVGKGHNLPPVGEILPHSVMCRNTKRIKNRCYSNQRGWCIETGAERGEFRNHLTTVETNFDPLP